MYRCKFKLTTREVKIRVYSSAPYSHQKTRWPAYTLEESRSSLTLLGRLTPLPAAALHQHNIDIMEVNPSWVNFSLV